MGADNYHRRLCNAIPHTDSYSYIYPDSDGYRYTNAYRYTNTDGYIYPDSHSDIYADNDGHRYTNAYGYSYVYPDSYSDCHTNADRNVHAERLYDYCHHRYHRARHHRHRQPLRRLHYAHRFALPGYLLRPDLLFSWYFIKRQPAIYGC